MNKLFKLLVYLCISNGGVVKVEIEEVDTKIEFYVDKHDWSVKVDIHVPVLILAMSLSLST